MFHGANESYKDDSAPSGIIHCTLIFAHLQRCRKKRVKREVEKKKNRQGKRQRKSSDPTYLQGRNDEGRKNYRKIIRNI